MSQVVKVEREKLEACMTCPLCHKLLRDATTISECLHTFCRKCIYDKINDDEVDTCPVCDTDLGCAPLEKLRADHNLEDLRAKIFPSKKRKGEAPEAASSVRDVPLVPENVPSVLENVPSAPLPGRRKERSISSLVSSAPQVSVLSTLTGKRSKSLARKNPVLRLSAVPIEEPVQKVDDHDKSLSSPETLSKIAQAKRQNSVVAESSKQHMPNNDTKHNAEPCEGKADLWKPLNCLVEPASKTKPGKPNLQETLVQIELPVVQENGGQVLKAYVKENGNTSGVNGDETNSTPSPLGSAKPKKMQGIRQKRAAISEGLNIPAQTAVDANSNCDGRFRPIWFSLVASADQEGDSPLPQISSCYLRIKDGCLPVSYIKKYLVQKLGLASEAEVEISVRGQPVLPTLQLHNLVDWWLQTTPASEKIQTMVGSSAKDFVMVLSYGRKA